MLRHKQQTIASAPGDFSKWHRGRREFTIWMIDLEHDKVLRKTEAARKHLSGLLLAPYDRQPHITLFVCGFLADRRRFDDDYAAHQLDAHCRMLQDCGIAPFTVEIGGLNSFASAPFLEVRDREGGIERLRALFSSTGPEIERDEFVPHVTVGLYSGVFDSRVMLERIEAFSDKPINFSIDRITFAAYDSSKINGPLVSKREVVLRKKGV